MSHYRGTRRRGQRRTEGRSLTPEMDLTPPTWLVALAAGATLGIGSAALYTLMRSVAQDRGDEPQRPRPSSNYS